MSNVLMPEKQSSNVTASNKIQSYKVKALLSDANRYLVPMYQRNYAWGEGEINQLIQDVLDYQQSKPDQTYYIGTLVVFKRKDGSFEVIDGQQRFTTLTLLVFALKRLAGKHPSIDMNWYHEPNLNFESRQKSTDTFASLIQGVALEHLKTDDYNLDVINGYALLEKGLLALGNKLEEFCTYLFDNVEIARVSVPKDTDLNHYFEVMNNRGEQLEKHEVVKARLMSILNNIEDLQERTQHILLLSKVWDATANMERYVQYGFSPDERHKVFGDDDWGQFTPTNYTELVARVKEVAIEESVEKNNVSLTMSEILTKVPQSSSGTEITLTPERFNSVINFSNFLLHVLRVLTKNDIALDDKRLLEQFDHYLNENSSDKVTAVKDFVFSLLKCKYLFDQYIIKREFNDGKDKWSLKRLHFYNSKSQSYINTFDDSKEQNSEDGFKGPNRMCLMLLSAFHVSTPTLVYKHWLNAALYYLYYAEEVSFGDYLRHLRRTAKRFIFDRFLSHHEGKSYFEMIYKMKANEYPKNLTTDDINLNKLHFGKIENNFVFCYLDYLLWRKKHKKNPVISEFEFTFRSSVEHFYPQHPLEGHRQLDANYLHQFGNLCLISHSKNSKLSNLQPTAKRDHFKAAIADRNIDTLKLYEMIKLMDDSKEWTELQIEDHGKEMLTILCGSTTTKKKTLARKQYE